METERRDNPHTPRNILRAYGLYSLWTLVLVGVAVGWVSEGMFSRLLSPAESTARTLFVALTQVQLGFVLVVWPLLLPRFLRDTDSFPMALLQVLVQITVLLLLSFPVVMVGQSVSQVNEIGLLRSVALVFSSSLVVACVYLLAHAMHFEIHAYYFFALFLTQVFLPYFSFLAAELTGADLSPLVKLLCPFAAAGTLRTDSAAFLQSGVFLGVAGAAAVAAFSVSRGSRPAQVMTGR